MNSQFNQAVFNLFQPWEAEATCPSVCCDQASGILKALNDTYKGFWYYEIISDERCSIEEDEYRIVVSLYIPNHFPITCRQIYRKDNNGNGVIERAIFNTLKSFGILSERTQGESSTQKSPVTTPPMNIEVPFEENKEEPEPAVGKVGEDITNITAEEFNAKYVKPFEQEMATSVNSIIAKDAETVMQHAMNKINAESNMINSFPKVNMQFQQGETEDQYYGRIKNAFDQVLASAGTKLNKPALIDLNTTDVPNEVAVYVQAYAYTFAKQDRPMLNSKNSWISGMPINIGNDLKFEVSEQDRAKWSHLTSEEIYIEKIIDHYSDIPDRLIPAMTKKFKAQGFQSMLITPQMAEVIDKRIYIKLKLMGYNPTLDNPFGELKPINKVATPPTNGTPTPPTDIDFNNPESGCPTDMLTPVQQGWDQEHKIETIVAPDPLKYYVPPKNKKEFQSTGVNQAGVPINRWGYTELQMDRMESFKEQHEIDANEKFDMYVKTWSGGKLTQKGDVNPSNIDEFLTWTESLQLGKALW